MTGDQVPLFSTLRAEVAATTQELLEGTFLWRELWMQEPLSTLRIAPSVRVKRLLSGSGATSSNIPTLTSMAPLPQRLFSGCPALGFTAPPSTLLALRIQRKIQVAAVNSNFVSRKPSLLYLLLWPLLFPAAFCVFYCNYFCYFPKEGRMQGWRKEGGMKERREKTEREMPLRVYLSISEDKSVGSRSVILLWRPLFVTYSLSRK